MHRICCLGQLLLCRQSRLSSFRQLGSVAEVASKDVNTSEEYSQTPPTEPPTYPEWTPGSRRTGVIALKLGMSQIWDKNGLRIPVTLLQVLDNEVVMVRKKEKEQYDALQIGAVNHNKVKRIIKPVLGQFKAAGVTPKRILQEFRVTPDAQLAVGTPLLASHFVVGQYVDVSAKSIGKGFQGVMKRHGMKGQPASHGVTKTHRKMGATGGGQDPGRVWPGKRMPGRMGGKTASTRSLKVLRINHRFNVLYLKGCVPGHKTTPVRVTDARLKPHQTPPPFPTQFIDPSVELEEESFSEEIHRPDDPSIEFPAEQKANKKRQKK